MSFVQRFFRLRRCSAEIFYCTHAVSVNAKHDLNTTGCAPSFDFRIWSELIFLSRIFLRDCQTRFSIDKSTKPQLLVRRISMHCLSFGKFGMRWCKVNKNTIFIQTCTPNNRTWLLLPSRRLAFKTSQTAASAWLQNLLKCTTRLFTW